MTKDLVLAIDQGTTGTTTLIIDHKLRVLAKVTQEFRQIFPKPGWVEHDLDDIWQSVTQTVSGAIAQAGVNPERIAAIGITNQRETVGLWDRSTGRPIYNAIVWQCRRTTQFCASLKKAGHEGLFKERTGLVLDPYFSGTKLTWLLDEVDGARSLANEAKLAAGTIDSFLVWRLTCGQSHVTDVSNVSRTLLFNIHNRVYDEELLSILQIPRSILPEPRSSSEVYGYTQGLSCLPDGIPIAGMAGDQQAALFGQACFSPGDVKCTYGTGAFVVLQTGHKPVSSEHGLLTTIAWQLGPDAPLEYALEGSVFCAGSAVQWLRDGLGILESAPQVESLAKLAAGEDELVFVPALTGLGAPHWNPEARGLITGITRGTGPNELARATLRGIAAQVHEVLEAFQADTGLANGAIRVDGGAATNNYLMQLQADLAGRSVIRPLVIETTAAGAAFLAGLGVGLFPSKETIAEVWQADSVFEPSQDRADALAFLDRWRAVISGMSPPKN